MFPVVLTKIARVILLHHCKTNYVTQFSSDICKINFTIKICFKYHEIWHKNKIIAEQSDTIIDDDTIINNEVQFRKLHRWTCSSFLRKKKRDYNNYCLTF